MLSSTQTPDHSHVDIIATEIKDATRGIDMSKQKLRRYLPYKAAYIEALEKRIFEIANQVALDVRVNKLPLYSNFHHYEHLRKIKSKAEASEKASAIATAIAPYGNCIFMADHCCKAFKAALLAENNPRLVDFAYRIELATSNWHQKAKSSREYHCLAMLRLWDHCIVLDPVAETYAIKVPLGEITKGIHGGMRFCYVAVGDYHRHLVWYEPGEKFIVLPRPLSQGKFEYSDPFMPVKGGFEGAIANLAWPSDSYIGKLPSRRVIWLQQTWDREPEVLPSADIGNGRYLVETAYVHFDFQNPQVGLTRIPYEDWLVQPENELFLRRIRLRQGFWIDRAHAHFEMPLGTRGAKWNKRDTENLALFAELCEALGLPKGELMRCANVMLELWQEYPTKKSTKRKR